MKGGVTYTEPENYYSVVRDAIYGSRLFEAYSVKDFPSSMLSKIIFRDIKMKFSRK